MEPIAAPTTVPAQRERQQKLANEGPVVTQFLHVCEPRLLVVGLSARLRFDFEFATRAARRR